MIKKVKGLVLIFITIFILTGCGKEKFIVEFKGTNISSIEVKEGEKLKQPSAPIKEDYNFVGWYLNGQKFDFNTPITKSITLEAKWEIKLTDKLYDVTFDTDGGSEIATQQINGNGLVLRPENPTKDGYTFVTWNLNQKEFDFENDRVKENLILKAVWKDNEKVTITFDTAGGGKVDSQVINSGLKATKPKNPIKTGHTFVSWQLNGKNYNFDEKVTQNITLVATWKKNAPIIPTLTNELATKLFQDYQKNVLNDSYSTIVNVKITHKGNENTYLVRYDVKADSDILDGGSVLVQYKNNKWNFELPGVSGFIQDGGPDDVFTKYNLKSIN